MGDPAFYSRRAFLARIGLLGAVLGAGGVVATLPVWASGTSTTSTTPGDQALEGLVDLIRPLLEALALDTMMGLAAMALPGTDSWSVVQGTPETTDGGVAAKGGQFLVNALDNFVPFPDELARPIAAAFSTALADLQLGLPNPIQVLPTELVDNVDSALSFLLQNDQTIPLSLAVALLLNMLATQVNPLGAIPPLGTQMTPFSRLSYSEKAQAFALIEDSESDLVHALDMELPEPLRDSVSGLLKYVGGSLLEFAAFGALSEFGVYDPATRVLESTPVGWTLSGYVGQQDGWDELKGYYQGRQEVTDIS